MRLACSSCVGAVRVLPLRARRPTCCTAVWSRQRLDDLGVDGKRVFGEFHLAATQQTVRPGRVQNTASTAADVPRALHGRALGGGCRKFRTWQSCWQSARRCARRFQGHIRACAAGAQCDEARARGFSTAAAVVLSLVLSQLLLQAMVQKCSRRWRDKDLDVLYWKPLLLTPSPSTNGTRRRRRSEGARPPRHRAVSGGIDTSGRGGCEWNRVRADVAAHAHWASTSGDCSRATTTA